MLPTKRGFKKHEEKIRTSQEGLIPRKKALGLQRLYGDPNKKIQNLLREAIMETLTNIGRAMEQEIVITKVNMPSAPKDWKKGLKFKLSYQMGDISPIFDDRLRSTALPTAGAEQLPIMEMFELSLDEELEE